MSNVFSLSSTPHSCNSCSTKCSSSKWLWEQRLRQWGQRRSIPPASQEVRGRGARRSLCPGPERPDARGGRHHAVLFTCLTVETQMSLPALFLADVFVWNVCQRSVENQTAFGHRGRVFRRRAQHLQDLRNIFGNETEVLRGGGLSP